MAGIRLSVRAELFGVEWANGPQNDKERYLGEITKWKSKKDDELYIRWEGWSRNAAISMAQLVGVDANGDAIDARLEAYEDGRPTPSYLDSGTPPLPEPSATTRRGGHGADGTGAADEEEADMAVEDDEEEPEATPAEVDKHGPAVEAWAAAEVQHLQQEVQLCVHGLLPISLSALAVLPTHHQLARPDLPPHVPGAAQGQP